MAVHVAYGVLCAFLALCRPFVALFVLLGVDIPPPACLVDPSRSYAGGRVVWGATGERITSVISVS